MPHVTTVIVGRLISAIALASILVVPAIAFDGGDAGGTSGRKFHLPQVGQMRDRVYLGKGDPICTKICIRAKVGQRLIV
jgi:hypothetical protein